MDLVCDKHKMDKYYSKVKKKWVCYKCNIINKINFVEYQDE